ncbi:MAG TPA: lipoyl synthase [Acidimicrobiales bacterium]|nr:lipoyl synthase [Acidimicrobiales bacterium]
MSGAAASVHQRPGPLRVRWLGRVRYREAHAVQRALWQAGARSPGARSAGARSGGAGDWLLLLEHPHVYTLGVRAKPEHVLVDPATVGAELLSTDRGGDVTYHGPGQLVGYPVIDVDTGAGATPSYVEGIEQLLIDVLADVGLPGAGRLRGYPGVWVDPQGSNPRKIVAIGVRLSRGRSMHGFALNVAPELSYFSHIVPCGIADKPVTSLAAEGVDVSMAAVVDAVVARAATAWGHERVERNDVAWRVAPTDLAPFTRGEGPGGPVSGGQGPRGGGRGPGEPVRLLGRLAAAGVDCATAVPVDVRKPEWLRVKARMGEDYRRLQRTVRSLDLVTVCEEAGCPNIYECWADGTATFMINGDRCTRACGFCLVDTRKPLALDRDEPERVATAVARLGLGYVVITCVARDDLVDGGSAAFAATIEAVHRRCPRASVEVLISDCKGDPVALETIFAARPEVLNHNVETVPRLQRAVRPSASYARSLSVLARAAAAGLATKSGLIVGMGETAGEVHATLADLAGIGVDIVTIGQYLRPTSHHLPVARWWAPEEFADLKVVGEALGIAHVEASPLTRSSYHARQAAGAVAPVLVATGSGAAAHSPDGISR